MTVIIYRSFSFLSVSIYLLPTYLFKMKKKKPVKKKKKNIMTQDGYIYIYELFNLRFFFLSI